MLLGIHAILEELGLDWDLRLGEGQLVARLEAVRLGLLELLIPLGRALGLLMLLSFNLRDANLLALVSSGITGLSGINEIIWLLFTADAGVSGLHFHLHIVSGSGLSLNDRVSLLTQTW